MTRTDSLVVGTLVVLLALIAGLVGVPSLLPATVDRRDAQRDRQPGRREPVSRRRPRPPVSVSPLTRPHPGRSRPRRARLRRARPQRPVRHARARTSRSAGRSTRRARSGRSSCATTHAGTTASRSPPRMSRSRSASSRTPTTPARAPARGTRSPSAPRAADASCSRSRRRSAGSSRRRPSRSRRPTSWRLPVDAAGRPPVRPPADRVRTVRGRQPDDDHAELDPGGDDPPGRGADARRRRRVATNSLATPGPARPPDPPGAVPLRDRVPLLRRPRQLAAAYRAGGLDAASGLSPALTRDLGARAGSRVAALPGLDPDRGAAQPAPRPSRVRRPGRADRPAGGDRPARLDRRRVRDRRRPATGPIPPASFAVRSGRRSAGRVRPGRRRGRPQEGRLDARPPTAGACPNAKAPLEIELLSPDQESNPAAFAAAEIVAGDWRAIGLTVTHVPLPPGEFVTGRLATGKFSAAVGDVTIGLDPDLYPLLASSQTVTGGSNVIGLQDPALDKLLGAARGPGTRRAAWPPTRPSRSSWRRAATCCRWPSRTRSIVVRDTLQGPAVRQVADPADRFWDVLTWRLAAGR